MVWTRVLTKIRGLAYPWWDLMGLVRLNSPRAPLCGQRLDSYIADSRVGTRKVHYLTLRVKRTNTKKKRFTPRSEVLLQEIGHDDKILCKYNLTHDSNMRIDKILCLLYTKLRQVEYCHTPSRFPHYAMLRHVRKDPKLMWNRTVLAHMWRPALHLYMAVWLLSYILETYWAITKCGVSFQPAAELHLRQSCLSCQ